MPSEEGIQGWRHLPAGTVFMDPRLRGGDSG